MEGFKYRLHSSYEIKTLDFSKRHFLHRILFKIIIKNTKFGKENLCSVTMFPQKYQNKVLCLLHQIIIFSSLSEYGLYQGKHTNIDLISYLLLISLENTHWKSVICMFMFPLLLPDVCPIYMNFSFLPNFYESNFSQDFP